MRRHHLDTATNRLPLTRLARGYALAGAAAALVLLALARLDLGDPEPAVRAGLERDAEARARLVLAGLGERLGAPALLAPCVGQEWRATREVEGAQTPIQPTISAPETETRPRSDVVHALLLITRERVEEGRPNDAREAIEQLLANPAVRPIDVAGRASRRCASPSSRTTRRAYARISLHSLSCPGASRSTASPRAS
jgi:hypothetical protein